MRVSGEGNRLARLLNFNARLDATKLGHSNFCVLNDQIVNDSVVIGVEILEARLVFC